MRHYLSNPNLKGLHNVLNLTEDQVIEYHKCSQDPVYFIENYVKVITLDKGFVKLSLYPFQKESIKKINENRKVILKAGRQLGKTTMIVGYIVWYILFNEEKFIAILANKASTAREILSRVKIAYEAIPLWMQQGVKTWNKGDIELENQCRVMATSTASSAIRGYSIHLLYLDEFAFVPSNIAEEFFTSVYPTTSSGETSKILISSTPNGMNHFYRMWTDAVEGRNGFVPIEANWRQVPGRTEQWAEDQKRVLGEQKYMQEVETEFLGSVGTLISAMALKSMAFVTPPHNSDIPGLKVYDHTIPNHSYVMTVDTSRGKGLDYSAFTVIDVTEFPYKVVATYKDNDISPLLYPMIIKKMADYYNQAYVLVEINDIGGQVVDILYDDYDYENILSTVEVKKKMIISLGFGNKPQRGIRTTKSVKRIGCSLLKGLIESKKLVITDFEIISELSTFAAKGTSYEAEEGSHDDLVMCLVLFAWLTKQQFFTELSNVDLRKKMYQQQMELIEQESLPMPMMYEDQVEQSYVENGAVWNLVGQ